MRKTLRLAAEALDELAAAAEWKFFPMLITVSSEREIRRALLSRFPYTLIFVELDSEIRVVAVAHAKRAANYWLARLQ